MSVQKPLKLVNGTRRQTEATDEWQPAGIRLPGNTLSTVTASAGGDVVLTPGGTGGSPPIPHLIIRGNASVGSLIDLQDSGGSPVFTIDESGDVICRDLNTNGSILLEDSQQLAFGSDGDIIMAHNATADNVNISYVSTGVMRFTDDTELGFGGTNGDSPDSWIVYTSASTRMDITTLTQTINGADSPAIQVRPGIGGTAGSGSPGGDGGSLALSGGWGGAGTASLAAGPGGSIAITGGSPGAANGGAGANGGSVSIAAASGTGTAGDGGDLTLDAGGVTGSGTAGVINFGETSASQIGYGHDGCRHTMQIDINHAGALRVREGLTERFTIDTATSPTKAIFNSTVNVADDRTLTFGDGADLILAHDSTNENLDFTAPGAGTFRFVADTQLAFGGTGGTASKYATCGYITASKRFDVTGSSGEVGSTAGVAIRTRAGTGNIASLGVPGGTGGAALLLAGAGGSTNSSAVGGDGGGVTIDGGDGGAATSVGNAGNGAGVTITGGDGGNSAGSTVGSGGNVTLTAGSAGTGSGTGYGGDIYIDCGIGTISGGIINMGVNGSSNNATINIGNSTTDKIALSVGVGTTEAVFIAKSPTTADTCPYLKFDYTGGAQETAFFQGNGAPSNDPGSTNALYFDYTNDGEIYWWHDTASNPAWKKIYQDSITMIAAAVGVTALDLIVIGGNNIAKGAQGSSLANARVMGWAVNTATSGNPVEVVTKQGTVIPGVLTGATFNTPYWLDASTAGAVTSTKPSTSGQVAIRVGYAINATDLLFQVGEPAVIA